ncbi:MAG: hypothetical protein ACREJ4_09805, partial [Candidatus Methylomirabilaceae bacterium]
ASRRTPPPSPDRARRRHQLRHHRIAGGPVCQPRVRRGDLRVYRLPQRPQRRELRGQAGDNGSAASLVSVWTASPLGSRRPSRRTSALITAT